MTYPYAVKVNGKWYRPYEDVPTRAKAVEPVIEPKAVTEAVAETAEEPKKRGRKPRNQE